MFREKNATLQNYLNPFHATDLLLYPLENIRKTLVSWYWYLVFELISLLLYTPIDALCWIKFTGIAYAEKRKTYILLNQNEIEIETKNCNNS